MSETIKDEMWRVAGNLIGGDNLGGSVIQLNYGTALGFLADKMEELRVQIAAQSRQLGPNRFDCPECGQGVAADEEGCCVTCGHDCDAHEDGVRVVTAERDEAKPTPPVGQSGGVRPPAISAAEMAKRAPLPPAVLADAHQESVHIESGIGRPAKSVKVRPTPTCEFRHGLPPLALRKVCARWEFQEGDRLDFINDGMSYVLPWYHAGEYRPVSDGHWDLPHWTFRPCGITRASVELLAAKMLGEEDARSGVLRRDLPSLAAELGMESLWPDDNPVIAYRTAYDGALSPGDKRHG